MYRLVGDPLPAGLVDTVRDVVEARLDLRAGPGGSFATDPTQTAAVLAPLLSGVFPGVWTQARVFGLIPSAQIVGHCDPPIVGRRYHLPVRSNPGCWSFHAGVWEALEIGRLYEMDPTLEHGAVNWGTTPRLHVVIDQEG